MPRLGLSLPSPPLRPPRQMERERARPLQPASPTRHCATLPGEQVQHYNAGRRVGGRAGGRPGGRGRGRGRGQGAGLSRGFNSPGAAAGALSVRGTGSACGLQY